MNKKVIEYSRLAFLEAVYARRLRQSVKITSDPQINHSKIEKRVVLFVANTNIFTLLCRQLSFLSFAV